MTEPEARCEFVDVVAALDQRSDEAATLATAAHLTRLFEQHADQLIRGLLAAGYPDAADAVQEAFVQAVVHWRRVGRYEDPSLWIRRVAINKARNRSRSRRRRAALADRLGQGSPGVVAASELPDDEVTAAVAALPAQQRLVVSLFYYDDLSVAQVSTVLGISEGTVKSQLHAARAAVAHALRVMP